MNMKLFAIYDTAVGAYMRPFVMQSPGQAIRAFEDMVSDPNHDIARHPEDYSLFIIGEFNDQTGEIVPESPGCLMRAHEHVALVNGEH